MGGQTRSLVDFQAEPVAKTVSKLLAVPGLGDHATRRRIHLAHEDARANRRDGLLLGCQHNSIYAFEFGRDSTGHQNARQVAAVEPRGSTPVDQDQITGPHLLLRWDGVRERRSGPHCHDGRKATAGPAETTNLMLQLKGDLPLGLLRPQGRADHAKRLFRQADRLANLGHLFLVFGLPLLLHQTVLGNQHDVGQRRGDAIVHVQRHGCGFHRQTHDVSLFHDGLD